MKEQNNKLASEIGDRIKTIRKHKGLSQQELADLAGTKQPTISDLEKGLHLPSLEFLRRVAYCLSLDLDVSLDIKSRELVH